MKARVKALTVGEILAKLEERAPIATAESWDNVGLLVGDASWKTSKAIVSVDLSREALESARKIKARLIVTHHPVIFPKKIGLGKIALASDPDRESIAERACRALSEGIAIASFHSNFDRCATEVIDSVAKILDITPKGRLFESGACEHELTKLVVYVPSTHLEKVRNAICLAGAGQIGLYDFCTFATSGTGTFRGAAESKPYLGNPGALESVTELRLETIFPKGLKSQVLRAMKRAHPYEEIAYDLYRVEQDVAASGRVKGLGYGFWGEFSKPKNFSEIAQRVSLGFQVQNFWASQLPPRVSRHGIKRMAFSAGDASRFYRWVIRQNCDLYVAGEFGYHAQLDAANRGLAVIELGHRESEVFFLQTMKCWLEKVGVKAEALNIPTQKIWTRT